MKWEKTKQNNKTTKQQNNSIKSNALNKKNKKQNSFIKSRVLPIHPSHKSA
jgi:hypothetical protein